MSEIDTIVEALTNTKEELGDTDHRLEVHQILSGAVLPLELAFSASLPLIVRDDVEYKLEL